MKYLILNSDNLILGYGDNPKGEHQASTSDDIPEYDINTQSIYWEGDQIVVKDDEQKIAENKERIATQYQRNRALQYPAIGDQLDDLYKKGAFSDEMAAKIKKVKDDNPKPS